MNRKVQLALGCVATSSVLAVHNEKTDGADRYDDRDIVPDNILRGIADGLNLYTTLQHAPECDIDTGLMFDYASYSKESFTKAWQRSDFHFEYRMFYLDAVLYFTDMLG